MLALETIAYSSTVTIPVNKQIAIFSNVSGTALYTVPAGRKFTGHFWGISTTTGNVTINGVSISFSGLNYNITPVSLAEGTILTKPDTTQIWIVGVEEDV